MSKNQCKCTTCKIQKECNISMDKIVNIIDCIPESKIKTGCNHKKLNSNGEKAK